MLLGLVIPKPYRFGMCLINSPVSFLSSKKLSYTDAIDSFTTELTEHKSLKWELIRQQVVSASEKKNRKIPDIRSPSATLLETIENLREPSICVDIRNLRDDQIDNLITISLARENFKDFYIVIDQCIEYVRCPSPAIFYEVFDFLVQTKNIECIEQLSELCRMVNPAFYIDNVSFEHYRALCFWRKGNSEKALAIFKDIYPRSHGETLRKILAMLKVITTEAVGLKGEAILISLIELAEYLNKVENNYFTLACVWKCCFFSSWFSDQTIADGLFDKYDQLRSAIGKRATFLTFMLLKNNNVEGAHRLIECFLKHDMKTECRHCMTLLFEYQYWRKDLRACSEIIRNCLDLEMPLSEIYSQKLLNLLLGKTTLPLKSKIYNKVPSVEYKF